jgi:hypothetical protein
MKLTTTWVEPGEIVVVGKGLPAWDLRGEPMTDYEMERVLEDLFTYHAASEDQKARYDKITAAAKELAQTILAECPRNPDRDDAIRLVRLARMTANASIATRSGGRLPPS